MTQEQSRLPADFLERARKLASGEHQPVPARDASTVVLLRPAHGRAGCEAYLLCRAPSMAFAAGMYVFPGGSVDPRDEDHEIRWAGPAPGDWARILDAPEPLARALVCAAVRETFEESGVLLAGTSDGKIVADLTDPEWEVDRQALLDRSVSFAELLDRRSLVLRSDLLRAWARWITPEFEPRRFDTRFFVAALPAGQRPRDVGGEAVAVRWMHVEDAIAGFETGELPMLPPTAFNLSEIAAYPGVDEVLAAAAARDVRPVLPRVLVEGDEFRFLLPGDPDYPQ